MFFHYRGGTLQTIVFRVDSSSQIGSGHLMRCLTLANQLKDRYEIVFISRDLEGNLNELVHKNGVELICLSRATSGGDLKGYEQGLTVTQEVDAEETKSIVKNYKVKVLIVDSYAIDEKWESFIRPYVEKIMVIDDLANRKHDCDILLDQNYYENMETRYDGLVPSHCKLLLGPQYALLREEFYEAGKNIRQRNGSINNILVFFGGSDLTNETMKALRAIEKLPFQNIIINVIVGGSNPHKQIIKDFCSQHINMKYHCQIDYIAKLMNEADLAIGAGGATTWERCFLGLPTIVVAIAENQIVGTEYCHRQKIISYIGKKENITVDLLHENLDGLLNNPEEYKALLLNVNNFMKNTNQVKFCEKIL